MEICFNYNGTQHCFWVPILYNPFPKPEPDPGPERYRSLINDATILATIQAMANEASDMGVRRALQTGFEKAIGAMRERAGSGVTINAAPSRQ
jgi:hypothetical protein